MNEMNEMLMKLAEKFYNDMNRAGMDDASILAISDNLKIIINRQPHNKSEYKPQMKIVR